MTNPQLTQNLPAVIRSLPPADRLWLHEQLDQDAELRRSDLAELAIAGGAFRDLADEPDFTTFSDGEAVSIA